jgi:hypothetical protein
MTNKFWLSIFILATSLAFIVAFDISFAAEASRDLSKSNKDAVLKYLRRIATSSNIAIRLYYRGACHQTRDSGNDEPVPFPFTKVQPPPRGSTGLAAVREVFKKDENVRVTEEAGIIRIRIGKVPTDILQTKLSLLTLDPIGQYNPNEAIVAINNTKEMEAAMRLLRLKPAWSASSSRTLPDKGLPHLPRSMRDMTVEYTLDLIAKTWDGPVIYGACVPTNENDGTRFLIDSAQDVIPKGAWKKMGIDRPE